MGLRKGGLTIRGLIIGCIGCVVLTATSVYTALKMGSLPWPIVFAAMVSLFFLKALGKTSLNEANVTHTVMSAGSMVAGGLAFTIPGIWILGAGEVDFWQMLGVALAGTLLGLVATGILRRHFVEEADLEFPIGEAAAQTLIAGDAGGSVGKKLFGAMGLAGLYALLRDGLGMLPALVAQTSVIPGVSFAIYNSPMMLSVGFLVGGIPVLAWFIGAMVGNIGLIAGASSVGLWDVATGQSIVSSLGMGCMMGCGVAIIAKDIVPKGISILRSGAGGSKAKTAAAGEADELASRRRFRWSAGLAACAIAVLALAICMALGLGPLASVVIVALSWVTSAMAAQSVGQTGIDPMEIFGLIVLLVVAAFSDIGQVQLFFVAGVISVACGIAGDVMNDFHAGHVLGTDPRAQLVGQAVGGILGAFVAAGCMFAIGAAYGPEAFGLDGTFVAAQASVVATMVSGIPHLPAFAVGLVLGFALYLAKLPAMMVGLGIYLPFYMSITACLGGALKFAAEKICRCAEASLSEEERTHREASRERTGIVVASGVLGGESVVGVLIAITALAGSFSL